MPLRDVPVCNIRYCRRDPASWILAGFTLLEQDGVLKIGKVRTFDQFLRQGIYAHNNIVEVEIEGHLVVFDYENGYRSFLRPALFDTQIEQVAGYFKANCDPSRYIGLKNKDKIHPFVAGTFTATCPGNPFDRVGLFNDGVSPKSVRNGVSRMLRRADYLRAHDLRRAECRNSFSDYSLLFWSRLSPVYTSADALKKTYPFLSEEEAKALADTSMQAQHEINRRRVIICRTLKKEYGDHLIGGIADEPYAQKYVPELITQDPRVTSREAFLDTMHTGVIGVVSIGHQYCIGARFGELLASGRAILSDSLRYVLPGDCKEGQNYLTFKNADTLCERVEYLLHNVDAVHAMEAQNQTYYAEWFHPRACVRHALQTVFPTHAGFRKQAE